MKRNFNHTFTQLDGQPFKQDDEVFTLKDAALAALQATLDDDRHVSGTEKVRRYKLALAIHSGDPVELTAEDVALIKDRINKCYGSPVIVAQAWEALDADPV